MIPASSRRCKAGGLKNRIEPLGQATGAAGRGTARRSMGVGLEGVAECCRDRHNKGNPPADPQRQADVLTLAVALSWPRVSTGCCGCHAAGQQASVAGGDLIGRVVDVTLSDRRL